MKTSNFIIILSIILTMVACTKENFETGFVGTIEIGYGDCMPPVDTTNHTYDYYKGKVYFISKSALNPALEYDFQKLKEISICEKTRNGKLSIELPPDTFVVMTEEYYFNSNVNTIIITQGQVLRKEIKCWICTSY